jgi:hypothetical protein
LGLDLSEQVKTTGPLRPTKDFLIGLALSQPVKTTGPWRPKKYYFLFGMNPLNPIKKHLRHLSAYGTLLDRDWE